MRRRALLTEAEINRAIKVARKVAAREVIIEGASIRIVLNGESGDTGEKPKAKVAKKPAALL